MIAAVKHALHTTYRVCIVNQYSTRSQPCSARYDLPAHMLRDSEALRVPLDTFVMQLRPSEVKAVASGMGASLALNDERTLTALAAALSALPTSDRAPLWELAIRHYARRTPLEQAAAGIGMDPIHARELLDAFSRALAQVA
jgi:hypothetical protein